MYQQLFIQRFCSVLFALLLALGPVVGSYAHTYGLPEKTVVSTEIAGLFASTEANQETSSKEKGSENEVPILKQSQVFHAVITGHLQLLSPCAPANYQTTVTPVTRPVIYPVATEAHSDALLVYHQALRHHFIAPQAP